MAPRIPTVPAVLLAALLLGGCGTGGGSRSAAPGAAVGLDAAVAAALSERPGRAVEAKMKTKDGIVSFEVDVLGQDGLVGEVDLGADGKPEGRMPWQKPDAPRADPEIAAAAPALAVDLRAALATALRASPGTARSVELSTSKETPRWKVKIWSAAGQEVEVVVDAATGQIAP